jgi:transposase
MSVASCALDIARTCANCSRWHAGSATRPGFDCHATLPPRYVPELNPDEDVWNYLKRVERSNPCCYDLADLVTALCRAKECPRPRIGTVMDTASSD